MKRGCEVRRSSQDPLRPWEVWCNVSVADDRPHESLYAVLQVFATKAQAEAFRMGWRARQDVQP